MSAGPSAGALVTPSIRLVRELGAGGMGSVWIADHLTLKTQVVVKFIARTLDQDAMAVARFSREAAAASQVKSPHVVQMLDHGIATDGAPFIAMELLEGRDLATRLDEPPRPTWSEVDSIVTQCARALSRAHEKGIVHRDIKPENIFLCDIGGGETFVKVLDFGIARGTEHHLAKTGTGQMLGTPYYMSPEQITGAKDLDHRCDLWALGVVTFQMLTGERPFAGETVGALAVAIHSAPLPVPTALDPSLPRTIDAWFAKVCSRAPAERFQTARDLAAALTAALGLGAGAGIDTSSASGEQPMVAPRDSAARVDGLRTHTPDALDRTAIAGSQALSPESVAGDAPQRGRRGLLVVGALAALLVVGGVAMLAAGRDRGKPGAPIVVERAQPTAATQPDEPRALVASSATASASASSLPSAAATASLPDAGPALTPSASTTAKPRPIAPTKPSAGPAAPSKPTAGYDDIQ